MAIQRQTGGARRLSVVVPATDVTGLEETLISVLEHRPDNSEIVVALGSPYDDPWNIREEVIGQLAGLRARGTRFVTAIPSLKVA